MKNGHFSGDGTYNDCWGMAEEINNRGVTIYKRFLAFSDESLAFVESLCRDYYFFTFNKQGKEIFFWVV